jgi:hypothetical protein
VGLRDRQANQFEKIQVRTDFFELLPRQTLSQSACTLEIGLICEPASWSSIRVTERWTGTKFKKIQARTDIFERFPQRMLSQSTCASRVGFTCEPVSWSSERVMGRWTDKPVQKKPSQNEHFRTFYPTNALLICLCFGNQTHI